MITTFSELPCSN